MDSSVDEKRLLEVHEEDIEAAFVYLCSAWEEKDGEAGWEAVQFVEDIEVSKKLENGIFTVRGLTTLELPASVAYKIGSGMDYWPVIDPYCVEGYQVKQIDENHEVLYSRYTAGIPLIADREFVFLESRRLVGDTYQIIDFSIDDPEILRLVKFKSGSVKGVLVKGGLTIRPITDSSCEVGFIVAINPMGWIPLWVANAFIGDEPLILKRLEEWAVNNLERLNKNP